MRACVGGREGERTDLPFKIDSLKLHWLTTHKRTHSHRYAHTFNHYYNDENEKWREILGCERKKNNENDT